MRIQSLWPLLKDTYRAWNDDKIPRLGAALAYYSVFSIAPLVMITIGIAGLIFGKEAARGEVVDEIRGTVGDTVAKAIQDMLVTGEGGRSLAATLIGIATLIFGAAGVFGQLQDALNTVWKVKPKEGRGIWGIIQDRFLSLTMVFGTGFLLLVSLVITAVIAGLSGRISSVLPGGAIAIQIANFVVSLLVVGLLFAMIFKYLPDVKVPWKDVWIGAGLTAIAFSLGKFALGWYLGRASTTSGFGAGGSLVVLLIWVYYASQIMLFGAEFTRAYAIKYGSGVQPAENAVPVSPAELAKQGAPEKNTLVAAR